MAKYIGRNNPYGVFEKQVFTPDNITTQFSLNYQAGSETSLLVIYGGEVQEPGIDYTLSNGGSDIVFSFVPQIGFNLYIIYLGRELAVPTGGGGGDFITNEVPIGLINGINKTYSTSFNYLSGTLKVFQNGLRMAPGATNDFIEISANVFEFNIAPSIGDIIIVDYEKA